MGLLQDLGEQSKQSADNCLLNGVESMHGHAQLGLMLYSIPVLEMTFAWLGIRLR